MPGSLLIVIITLYFLLVMRGANIITDRSLVSVPCRSPSLLSPQSSSAQHRSVLTETQNEPAKFTLRFIAYITLAHVYANSDLHIQNVCLPLLANVLFLHAIAVHANFLLLASIIYSLTINMFPKKSLSDPVLLYFH